MTVMEDFEKLLGEADAQMARLKQMVEDPGEVDAKLVLGELQDTVMSLLVDVGASAFSGLAEVYSYLHEEVEPMLLAATGDLEDSQLTHEDAVEIAGLLSSYRASMAAGIEAMEGESRAAFEKAARDEMARIDAVLARIEEMRLPPDDEEETDPEGDDPTDEDETPEADAAETGTSAE